MEHRVRSGSLDAPAAWSVLSSAGFVAGLALLLLNDFALKQHYPGIVTGKLSDFAGLWVFPMFVLAFVRGRAAAIYVATALGFVLWKSPLSQPVIDTWNGQGIWHAARAVDYTDLAALAVLPMSLAYARRMIARPLRGSVAGLVALPLLTATALFAFVATSVSYTIATATYGESDPANIYLFDVSKDNIIMRLDNLRIDRDERHYRVPDPPAYSFTYDIAFKSDVCKSWYRAPEARAEFRDLPSGRSEIILLEIRHTCEQADGPKVRLREQFEREVIERLRS